jgi:hypothetical protein
VSIVILRYALFPSASHISVSIDAVEVKLGMIGYPSWNLTNIPLGFTEAHHKKVDRSGNFFKTIKKDSLQSLHSMI